MNGNATHFKLKPHSAPVGMVSVETSGGAVALTVVGDKWHVRKPIGMGKDLDALTAHLDPATARELAASLLIHAGKVEEGGRTKGGAA